MESKTDRTTIQDARTVELVGRHVTKCIMKGDAICMSCFVFAREFFRYAVFGNVYGDDMTAMHRVLRSLEPEFKTQGAIGMNVVCKFLTNDLKQLERNAGNLDLIHDFRKDIEDVAKAVIRVECLSPVISTLFKETKRIINPRTGHTDHIIETMDFADLNPTDDELALKEAFEIFHALIHYFSVVILKSRNDKHITPLGALELRNGVVEKVYGASAFC